MIMSDTTTYNKENFLQHLEMLKPNGYILNNEGFYAKDEIGRKIRLFIDTTKDFPFDVRFSGASVHIRFTEVEQIFHQVWQNFPNTNINHSLTASTFVKGFRKDIIGTSGYQFLINNHVSDTTSFNEVYPYLNELMSASVNFVNQYVTLQDFYNYGEDLTAGIEMSRFYSQPLTARKMIIKKLLSISDYSTYATTVINNANASGNIERANFLQALKNYLDTL